jgi:hypothetical protein
MPLNPNVPLKANLYCVSCSQYCPSIHPRISEWWDWHAKNCKPKKTTQNASTAEPYAPWAIQHIKQSDETLPGFACAISPTELLALLGGQAPQQEQTPSQMPGPPQYNRQGPY